METIIYFVRHADSTYIEGMERSRGLSENGKLQSLRVKEILAKEEVDHYISSPYERAIQTIKPSADEMKKEILVFEDLRERAIGKIDDYDFKKAKRKVYLDFSFKFLGGESSIEAQERAIKALNIILDEYRGQKVVIGTHEDIMTLMMNFYDKHYDIEFWETTTMPDIYKLKFEGSRLINVQRLWE